MGLDHPGPSLGIGEFLSIGSYNFVCVLAGMGLGWWADTWWGSTPVLTLVGLAAGVALGVFGTWRRLRPLMGPQLGPLPGQAAGSRRPGPGESRTTDGEREGPH